MARDIEEVASHVVDAALRLRVDREFVVPFEFDGERFERGLRVDMLVDDQVVVELKSQEKLEPVHYKQVLTYLRLLDLRLGLLVNFGCATLKQGLRRIVNGYQPTPASPLRINQDPAKPS